MKRPGLLSLQREEVEKLINLIWDLARSKVAQEGLNENCKETNMRLKQLVNLKRKEKMLTEQLNRSQGRDWLR